MEGLEGSVYLKCVVIRHSYSGLCIWMESGARVGVGHVLLSKPEERPVRRQVLWLCCRSGGVNALTPRRSSVGSSMELHSLISGWVQDWPTLMRVG